MNWERQTLVTMVASILEHRRERFLEEEHERLWNQGIWMPQILDGFGSNPNPSLFKTSKQRIWIWPLKSKSKDPNRMPTNRYSDLPKNIKDGEREEPALDQMRYERAEEPFFFFFFLIFYIIYYLLFLSFGFIC